MYLILIKLIQTIIIVNLYTQYGLQYRL